MRFFPGFTALALVLGLAACGGGGGSSGGDGMGTPSSPGGPAEPDTDPNEPTDPGIDPTLPAEPSGDNGVGLPDGFGAGESADLAGRTVQTAAFDPSLQVTVGVAGGPRVTLDAPGVIEAGFNAYENDQGGALVSRVGEATLGTTLDYTGYGVWFLPDNADAGSFAGVSETPAADVPIAGTATYTGGAVAALSGGSGAITGAFAAEADFQRATVDGSIDFTGGPDVDLGAVTINRNGAIVGEDVAADGFDPGTVRGRFGGPAAEEITGFFSLDGNEAAMRGAFGGKRAAP